MTTSLWPAAMISSLSSAKVLHGFTIVAQNIQRCEMQRVTEVNSELKVITTEMRFNIKTINSEQLKYSNPVILFSDGGCN